jgi:hypothetical protein
MPSVNHIRRLERSSWTACNVPPDPFVSTNCVSKCVTPNLCFAQSPGKALSLRNATEHDCVRMAVHGVEWETSQMTQFFIVLAAIRWWQRHSNGFLVPRNRRQGKPLLAISLMSFRNLPAIRIHSCPSSTPHKPSDQSSAARRSLTRHATAALGSSRLGLPAQHPVARVYVLGCGSADGCGGAQRSSRPGFAVAACRPAFLRLSHPMNSSPLIHRFRFCSGHLPHFPLA